MSNLTPEKYYSYRKLIHKLYENDTVNNGDLCSDVLQIRDKNRCVLSIKIALQDNLIDVEFEDETPIGKKIKIAQKILNNINKYITNNKFILGEEAKEKSFDDFLNSDRNLFCDICMVGNNIKFNL